MGWHTGVMVGFDLETTGPSPDDARIVTACVVTIDGSGTSKPRPKTWLVDPGIDIPAGATAIHGVTTEQARANGVAAQLAVIEIVGVLADAVAAGHPIIAFNASYDFTVLDREARHRDCQPLTDVCAADDLTLNVIDPFVLDKMVSRHGLQVIERGQQVRSFVAYKTRRGEAVDDDREDWPILPARDRAGAAA